MINIELINDEVSSSTLVEHFKLLMITKDIIESIEIIIKLKFTKKIVRKAQKRL